MRDLTVSLVQADLHWEDRSANLRSLSAQLRGIEQATDLVVLPEMFATGFSMRAEELAEPADGPGVDWMRSEAARLGSAIAGSLMVREGGSFFNRFFLVEENGRVSHYDKRHLFRMAGEEKIYAAGDRIATVTLHGWRLRPFVCYDLRFPIWCRNVSSGYDVALFVANWPAKRASHWRTLLRARAIENQAWVVAVNRVGTDGNGYAYSGDSCVIDAQGNVVWSEAQTSCVQTITLSMGELQACREAFPAWRDADAFELDEIACRTRPQS